jgi:hypothetical protein
MKPAPLPKGSDGLPAPMSNPVGAALDPDGAHAFQKVPITPPPMMIGPYWGDNKGVHPLLLSIDTMFVSISPFSESVHICRSIYEAL